jgi:hypothetical protein
VRRDAYLQQSRMINLSACKTINSLHESYEDYMRDLTYLR